ncbi:MAG: WYL domain-containing protein, partial [Actinomycetota bacterium]
LAEEFDVSRRTIERDLASLRAAGVPLYAERGRTGGQVSLDELGSVVVTLTPGEVTALLVAVAAAADDMPYLDAATEATKRLLDGLGPSTRVGVAELRSRIRTSVPGHTESDEIGADGIQEERTISRRVKRSVETAVQRGVVVNLRYRDRAGDETDRAVDPVGFYQGRDGWFLIGWCHLRRAGRIFRLDRVVSARLTRRPADRHDVDETLGWTPNELATP